MAQVKQTSERRSVHNEKDKHTMIRQVVNSFIIHTNISKAVQSTKFYLVMITLTISSKQKYQQYAWICITDAMGGPQQPHRYPQQSSHMMQQQKGQMGPGTAMPPGGMMGVNGSQAMPRVPASAGFGTRPPMQGRCGVTVDVVIIIYFI